MGGGAEMERLYGIMWTQNGGEICKTGCDIGLGMFSCKERRCSATIFAKSTRNVWNRDLNSNSTQRKIVLSHLKLCWIVWSICKSEMKVHTIWVFLNFHFRTYYCTFWFRCPWGIYWGLQYWIKLPECRIFKWLRSLGFAFSQIDLFFPLADHLRTGVLC